MTNETIITEAEIAAMEEASQLWTVQHHPWLRDYMRQSGFDPGDDRDVHEFFRQMELSIAATAPQVLADLKRQGRERNIKLAQRQRIIDKLEAKLEARR
jgi:hypothetical protein